MSTSLTVIVCAYQAEAHITRALNSLESRSATAYNIIVVNDGSNDKTKSLIERHPLAQNRDRFTFIDKKKNDGLAAACNSALQAVKTEFFVRLDADDEFTSDAIAEFIAHSAADTIVYSDRFEVSEKSGTRRKVALKASANDIVDIVACGVVFETERARKAGGYRSTFWEEYDFWIRYLQTGPEPKLLHLKEPLYVYYRSSNSMTGSEDRLIQGFDDLKKLHSEKVLQQYGLSLNKLLSVYKAFFKDSATY